ncbi:Cyclic nucleotide-binding domain-containing protein [Desulfacinum hydrothermale DSM 13146]|uniref:Cyclic nucleotide-binding domain-containing protein n=1 Tax=Desulfacinum hydrothermale DSM 13146 TaxID=1121390 RepID=A0A1W1XUL8_9BACT|nr:cyclic nucleotide-binding domain-containing protein [Desulfacinum hydrothermale]SMC27596.1 Cyclic nucleotide-binding domain-containing protein [Desulfacinum hydrothermale DSM 13146]
MEHEKEPAYSVEPRTYQEGELILSENDPLDAFFVMLSGRAKVFYKGRKVRVLGEQDVFGLEGALGKRISTCDVRASESCRVLAYDYEALDDFFENHPRRARTLMNSVLRQLLETTAAVQGEDVVVLPHDVEIHYFDDGQTIVREGDPSTQFYRLVSSDGGLLVTFKGREVGRIEAPGEFFGEMACLLGGKRQATVTSVGRSVVQMFRGALLERILSENPQLALKLVRTLAHRLIRANVKLSEKDLKTSQWKDFV